MTTPRPETLEREKDKLYLSDAELYRRLGVPYATAKPVIEQLEAKAGFPRKQQSGPITSLQVLGSHGGQRQEAFRNTRDGVTVAGNR